MPRKAHAILFCVAVLLAFSAHGFTQVYNRGKTVAW